MNALRIFRTKPHSWQGCDQPSAAERMAKYSTRHAAEIQQRENAGAALPLIRFIDGRRVLVALDGHVNKLPKETTA